MTISQDTLNRLGVSFIKEARGISEFKLKSNGLKIVLAENHASPVVTVMPVYLVGSRNEAVGHTGATHILEHMMFKGVKSGRTGETYVFDDILRPLGGAFNASTSPDRTNYFEVVPSEHLEVCIALEADRMRNLILNADELKSEMTVVRNELERGEGSPWRVLMQNLYATVFREHPYHAPTIGWHSDVEAITVERLKLFYDEHYWPDNTTVMVIGDFDSEKALELIAKYYGVHPAAPKPITPVHTVESKQEGPRSFTIHRPTDTTYVSVAYPIPAAIHGDTHAIAAAAAVLGGESHTTRFYKSLVATGMTAGAFTVHLQHRDPGMLFVGAIVAPGVDPQKVIEVIESELAGLSKNPVTAEELRLAKASYKKNSVLSAADPMRLADALAEAEAVADWSFYVNFADKLDAVTPNDVARVAATHFIKNSQTIGIYTAPLASATEPTETDKPTEQHGTPKAKSASFSEGTSTVKLDNGITLVLMPAPGNGIVGISGRLAMGNAHAPSDKALIATATSGLLTAGSATRSATDIVTTTEEMGTGLQFGTDNFSTRFGTQVVNTDLNPMLDLIADLLQHPSFPQGELDVWKMQVGSNLQQQNSNTEATASATFHRALYDAKSPYHQKSVGELMTELEHLSTADLQAFHQTHVSPKGMVLALVGDFDAEAAKQAVTKAFGHWTGPDVTPVSVAATAMPTERKRIDVAMPGKANASIVIGHPSELVKGADDYTAATLANIILGGGMSARLAEAVRVKAGYTYGIYSSFGDTTRGGAPWAIELSVNPINIDKALVLIDEVVEDFIKNGVTEKELSAESKAAAGSFVVNLRRYDSIASVLADYVSRGQDLKLLDEYSAKLNKVTVEQVNAAIRKHIRPESFVTVVAGTIAK